jgi:RND family efflux transporter MFP subunit
MKIFLKILFASLLFLTACGSREEDKEALRPVFYQKIAETSKPGTRIFAGISKAKSEAKLSFKVGGTLEKIHFKMGEEVKKGEILAHLNSVDYKINYDKALASKKNADVQLITAKSSFMRIENLYANNNASLNDFEKAKAQYESARAMANTAKAQLETANNQLNYTKLIAPYDGSISNILSEENEMIGAGRPVLVYSSDNDIEIRTAVPENIIAHIKAGQKVTIRFSTINGRDFDGEISEIGRSSGASSTYPLIITLNHQSNQLLPGMACTIEMQLNGSMDVKESIIIPSDAVAHDEGGNFVYVVKESSEKGIYIAKRRNVTLGQLTASGYEIKDGLSHEDVIITAGLSFMYDGRKVKLLDNFNR